MVRQILDEFVKIRGITAAALIGRDGFVIEIVQITQTDGDTLAVLSSDLMRFFDQWGIPEEMRSPRSVMLEYHNSILIIIPVTGEEYLVIRTDTAIIPDIRSCTFEKIASRFAAVI